MAGGLAGLLCWQGHLVEWHVGRRAIVRNNKSLDAPGLSTTTPPFPLRHLLFLLPPLSLCLCSSYPPNNSKEHERRSPRYSHAFFTHNSIAPAAYQGTVYANRGSYTWTRPALVACQGLGVAVGARTARSWLTTEDS